MRYVVNQENGQRYYPFIFRRNNGESIVEYPYALAGNHMFWCGEDLDSLRLQFSVNGYSEVTTGKVSYEFRELLVSVAKENDALAQQDDTTKRECELLNRFAEDYMVDYDEERMKSFWTWAKSAIEEISLKRYSLLARVCGYWDGETKDRYFSSVEELMEVCEYNDLLNCTRVFVNCMGGTTEEATFQELFDLNGTQSTQEIEEKVLDDSPKKRETERIVAEREKRYEEKLRRSRISLHSIYESIYGKEEIKTVYVKDKNSYEEIYAALSKAYTGAFSTVFLESVEHILQNAEDEKMQVAMLSGIVNVEEVDASDERLIENQKFEMDELTPEAEKLINNLKKFLADMPFAGERPVYEVTDKSDVDEIIDELLGTLQSSGNMMHVMQLKAYRHSSAISGSRAAKIELIKICADVTQPENEKSEEVIETEESEPAGEEMETGEETCQEDMPELQYKELTDGTMALFCYASANWRLLIDEAFEEEKIPVMIWNNYLCYANSEQLKKVNLADGEVRIRDVSDVQAGNFSVSIEANILSNADFVIDDENEELILKAFT